MRPETTVTEQDILDAISAARIRLRFDKVVRRLIVAVRVALAAVVPDGEAIVFTLAAPVRQPAKTAAALETRVRDGLPDREHSEVIHGNRLRIRRLTNLPPGAPNLLGFVHDPAADAGGLLDIVESLLSA